jgi:hypothetical protein
MPGRVPGIHAFVTGKQGVDGRDKPGHDADALCHHHNCLIRVFAG